MAVVWVSCLLWVSRVSSSCFRWDGHVEGVSRCVTESICLHAGLVSAGDRRADELRPHPAGTRYVARVREWGGGAVSVRVCSDGVP